MGDREGTEIHSETPSHTTEREDCGGEWGGEKGELGREGEWERMLFLWLGL